MYAIYPFTGLGRQTVLNLAVPFAVLSLLCLPYAVAEDTNAAAPIYVHYMPWFASKPVSGEWGYHWTMNHFNPDEVDAPQRKDEKRPIASHHYPLIGPYDSGDPAVLEYHTGLMKAAGIDGVIFDWYGIRDANDYGMIHRNTLKMIAHLKLAGLKFAICYEDRTIPELIRSKEFSQAEATEHGQQVVRWLQQNWFSDPAYVRIDNRPLLLVFGPLHFKQSQWEKIRTAASPAPLLCGLPHLSNAAGFDGSFGWPPVTGGETIKPEKWRSYLRDLYSRGGEELTVGAAFPGYHDIYAEASEGDSYGRIEERDGKTFDETLQLAEDNKSRLIQIATWNDFGEGTAIEPTEEHGYRYLETIQRRRRPQADPSELRIPFRQFQRQKKD